MQNEPKDQDLDSSANHEPYSLKILNLRDNMVATSVRHLSHASDTRIFLTFIRLLVLTLQTPMSFLLPAGVVIICFIFNLIIIVFDSIFQVFMHLHLRDLHNLREIKL
mgnify:CR=1 FL=1